MRWLGVAVSFWLASVPDSDPRPRRRPPPADGERTELHFGGVEWDTWSRKLATAVVATQVSEGDASGTWDPVGTDSRLVTTALHVLTLQMYYRYSRLVR